MVAIILLFYNLRKKKITNDDFAGCQSPALA